MYRLTFGTPLEADVNVSFLSFFSLSLASMFYFCASCQNHCVANRSTLSLSEIRNDGETEAGAIGRIQFRKGNQSVITSPPRRVVHLVSGLFLFIGLRLCEV